MNAPTTLPPPTPADVDAAAARIKGVAVRTPLLNFPVLDERLGARVFLKAETLQRTGSSLHQLQSQLAPHHTRGAL